MQVKALTNKQLAGQRLMVGFNGTDLNEDLKFLIKQLKVGGIILFAQNLKTPATFVSKPWIQTRSWLQTSDALLSYPHELRATWHAGRGAAQKVLLKLIVFLEEYSRLHAW